MNRRVKLIFLSVVLCSVAFLQKSCVSHDFSTYTPCGDEVTVSFQADIKPIIETKCAIEGCHNGSTTLPNWNDFSTFQDHSRNGSVKDFVIHRVMPKEGSPAGPLTQEQINTIACWIDKGSLDN